MQGAGSAERYEIIDLFRPSSVYTGVSDVNASGLKQVKLTAVWSLISYVKNFSYTGATQTFTAPYDGYYKVELWGAQGNYYDESTDSTVTSSFSAQGSYSSGIVYINKATDLYTYVGQHSHDASRHHLSMFNGGSQATHCGVCGNPHYSSSGGGATDIRTVDGSWDDSDSLKSRIMVAGAGGGLFFQSNTNRGSDGHGGGLSGYNGLQYFILRGTLVDGNYDGCIAYGGTQNSGGKTQTATSYSYGNENGKFGKGGNGALQGAGPLGGGGGGGWYGGGGGTHNSGVCVDSGGGGSSYISGMSGSIGVTESGSPKCSAGSVSVSCSESWTGYKIVTGTALMIDGAGHKWPEGSSSAESGYTQMPNPSGGYYASGVGHSGNGYARITYLGTLI